MFNSPLVYVYTPDPEKSLDDNLAAIQAHMRLALAGQSGFRLTLELDMDVAHCMTTEEVTAVIERAQRESELNEKATFVPVAVDANNRILYQRKEDTDNPM